MGHRRAVGRRVFAGAAILLLAVIGVPGLDIPRPACADMTIAGNIKMAEGVSQSEALKIVRSGYGSILSGRPGDAVFIGDAVKTGERVKVRVELSDSTAVIIAPDSAVQISALHVDRGAGRRTIALKVLKGTARFQVPGVFKPAAGAAESPWKESSVTIETVHAVAALRGTDVIVTVSAGDAEFAVIEGVVGVRSAQPGSKDEVVLRENQASIVGKGGIPAPAESLAAERRDLLVRRTTLEKGVTDLAAVPARGKPGRIYTQNDVARDIAAGTTLSETVDRAVENGMSPEQAVGAVMHAGVSADAVVYTAIQEGYSPVKVVQAAISQGAPSALVFSAALAAGADRQQIVEGAQAAGMPPTAIAGSMASAMSGDVPSPGATGTGGAAGPLAVLPLTAVPIGGGGGATPSASPYRP